MLKNLVSGAMMKNHKLLSLGLLLGMLGDEALSRLRLKTPAGCAKLERGSVSRIEDERADIDLEIRVQTAEGTRQKRLDLNNQSKACLDVEVVEREARGCWPRRILKHTFQLHVPARQTQSLVLNHSGSLAVSLHPPNHPLPSRNPGHSDAMDDALDDLLENSPGIPRFSDLQNSHAVGSKTRPDGNRSKGILT